MDLGILIGLFPTPATPLNTVLRPALGGVQAEQGERVRELSLRRCGPSRLRTLVVHRPCVRRRRSRRGGGAGDSMAASLGFRGAASGLWYWSGRRRPVGSLAAGKDLAPHLLFFLWSSEEGFSPEGLRLV